MKILHTADWHVGRTIRGRSRHDEHVAVLGEIAAVAAAENVTISTDRFERLKEYMDNIPPTTRSSLLIDLEMGKRIEVEALQGAAVRRAEKHGVPVPIISTLYAVLRPHARGR